MTRCAGYERHLGLRYFIASSPQTTGRIVFVNLRTGNSLSVALHLPSQERSYFQLMGPNQTHEGTCTLLFRRLRRRTKTDFPVRRLSPPQTRKSVVQLAAEADSPGGTRPPGSRRCRQNMERPNISRDAQASGLKRTERCNVCHSSTRELTINSSYCER
jgi:hypothetical protein